MNPSLTCHAYFEPKYVWEIKAADLSLSSKHTAGAGLVDPEHFDKGIALRFNRHIRERPDKGPTEATTTQQIVEMYRSQAAVRSAQDKHFNDNDDYDF